MEIDPEGMLILVKARLDPSLVQPYNHPWCREWAPDARFVCSRIPGHKGPHIAQYEDGALCPIKPWI